MPPRSAPTSRCAMASVTARSRVGFAMWLAVMLGAIAPAAAQPASRRPAAKQLPPEPAVASDPEARARLDEQAAALAAADRKLAEQQQVIDNLSAALADARREQASLATAQQALQ